MADTLFSTTAVVSASTNFSHTSHAAFAAILGQLEEAVLLEQLTLGSVGDPAMSGLEDDTVTAWDNCETALAKFVADPTARPLLAAAAESVLAVLRDAGSSRQVLLGHVADVRELAELSALVAGKPIPMHTVTQLRCATKLLSEIVALTDEVAFSEAPDVISLNASAA